MSWNLKKINILGNFYFFKCISISEGYFGFNNLAKIHANSTSVTDFNWDTPNAVGNKVLSKLVFKGKC